jgi:hypothetical protein
MLPTLVRHKNPKYTLKLSLIEYLKGFFDRGGEFWGGGSEEVWVFGR